VVVSFFRSQSPERSSSALAGRAQKTLFAEVTLTGVGGFDLAGCGSDTGEKMPVAGGGLNRKQKGAHVKMSALI